VGREDNTGFSVESGCAAEFADVFDVAAEGVFGV